MKKIINCETNEVIEIELSKEDITQRNKNITEANKIIKKEEAEAEAKAIAKAAILDRIGLSADELKTILG